MIRVLVCGGRDFDDELLVLTVLLTLHNDHGIFCVIHGAARGADTLAGRVARELGIEVYEYPADWNAHGRRAGPIRNEKMLREGKPDLVVAFPGGIGTADMVNRAWKAGIKVMKPFQ